MTTSALAPTAYTQPRAQGLVLRAPGRLHLGFLDPAGTLGRRFGSLGLVLEGFETVVEISAATHDSVTGPHDQASEIQRARDHLANLKARTSRTQPVHLHLHQLLPVHAGLGSGTQLALAVGRAFVSWHDLQASTATIASWLGRGLRSGVGIAGFDQGGLLLDGGPGAPGRPAPLLARMPMPEAWHIIVAMEPGRQGLSGSAEKQALATLAPLSQEQSADVCHQVVMRVLPGLADLDFECFAAGLTRIQHVLGSHFAPAQGGQAFSSPAVARAVHWIADQAGPRASATGQSSWGPTGFVIVPSKELAVRLVADARAAGVVAPSLVLQVVQARNRGAVWTSTNAVAPAVKE